MAPFAKPMTAVRGAILFCALGGAVLIASACSGGSPAPTATRAPAATAAPAATSTVVVSLATTPPGTPAPAVDTRAFVWPQNITVARGSTFRLMVWVNPAQAGMSGGEVTVKAPTDALTMVDIRAGDVLGANAIIGQQSMSAATGEARIAVARVGATKVPSSAGSLAIINFKCLDSAKPGQYTVSLQASLADDKFGSLNVTAVQGATVTVQ